MVYSPFDFNEAVSHRKDYVEDKLSEGSPVVGLSFSDGLLLLTLRKSQRKIFEIYDRLIYSAIGNQSDIEAIRIGAIDVAHREGYERSPDDITALRLVGFSLSPPLKKLFGDTLNAPAVIRAIFGEMGETPNRDHFLILNYDGEFSQRSDYAVVAGTWEAEDKMLETLSDYSTECTLGHAIQTALATWAIGALEGSNKRKTLASDEKQVTTEIHDSQQDEFLANALKTMQLEIGLLDRRTNRESKFRLLTSDEIKREIGDTLPIP
jgi:proteasome alpha subunit